MNAVILSEAEELSLVMPWTCPTCARTFKNPNQPHSCQVYDLERHFENRSEEAKQAFEKLLQMLPSVGLFTINPLKNAIQFKNPVTFLSVQFKRDHLMLEFYLAESTNDPRISKTLQLSKNRIVHYLPVQSEEDITVQVLNWIQQSYELVH